jgi:hypothetical protein
MSAFDGDDLLGPTVPEDAVRWYLTRIARGIAGDPLEGLVDELRALYPLHPGPAVIAGFMRDRVRNYGTGFRLIGVEWLADHAVVGIVETDDGTRWRVAASSDPNTDSFGFIGSAKAPAGFRVRAAEPEDGPALAELIRRVPMNVGDDWFLIDYGHDYLAATAMATDRLVALAENDGGLLAIHGHANVTVVVDGLPHDSVYLRHTRVDPSTKGSGVFSALNGFLFEQQLAWAGGSMPSSFSLVAVANDSMLRVLPDELRRWGTPWERLHLDARALAGESGRRRTDQLRDRAELADLLEHMQAGADVRLPVDRGWVDRRLDGCPELYGPERVRGGAGAAVGVGRSTIGVRRKDADNETREAVVFDIAFESGADEALRETLRGWCDDLVADGVDRLVIGCGSSSRVHAALAPLAVEVERYHLNCSWPAPVTDTPSFAFDHALM